MIQMRGIQSFRVHYVGPQGRSHARSEELQAYQGQNTKIREGGDEGRRVHRDPDGMNACSQHEGTRACNHAGYLREHSIEGKAEQKMRWPLSGHFETRTRHVQDDVLTSAKEEFLAEVVKSGTEEMVELIVEKIDSLLESGGLSEEQTQAVGQLRDEFTAKIEDLVEQFLNREGDGTFRHDIGKLLHGIKHAFRELYHGLRDLLTQEPEVLERPFILPIEPPVVEPPPSTGGKAEPEIQDPQLTTASTAESTTTDELGLPADVKPGNGGSTGDVTDATPNAGTGEASELDVDEFLGSLRDAFRSGFGSMRKDLRVARRIAHMFGHHRHIGHRDRGFMQALHEFIEILREKLIDLYKEQEQAVTSANDTAKTHEQINTAV